MNCQHELPIEQCSICTTAVKTLAKKKPTFDVVYAARSGRCSGCGDIYEEGDEVIRVTFWWKPVHYHHGCAEEKLNA